LAEIFQQVTRSNKCLVHYQTQTNNLQEAFICCCVVIKLVLAVNNLHCGGSFATLPQKTQNQNLIPLENQSMAVEKQCCIIFHRHVDYTCPKELGKNRDIEIRTTAATIT